MSRFVNFYEIEEIPGIFHAYIDILQTSGYYSDEEVDNFYRLLHNKVKFFLFDYHADHQKKQLTRKLDKDDILVFDHNYEGWSPDMCPIAQTIHEKSAAVGHNLENIFYISGNFREKDCYDEWCSNNDISEKINIVEVCAWDTFNYNNYGETNYLERRLARMSNISKNFIYLSRRARPTRTLLTKELHDNNLIKGNVISHDKVDDGYFNDVVFGGKNYDDFKSTLPIIADTQDFETNWANFLCEDIHLEAYFSVVGETWQDDFNETSMFFSEKTFRPMLLGMPMLIWGQCGCNNFLFRKMKYKPYDAWFDYGFDSISDNTKRCRELTKQLVSIDKMLKSMSKSQRIDWATKDLNTLKYNMNRSKYNENSFYNFKIMANKIFDKYNTYYG